MEEGGGGEVGRREGGRRVGIDEDKEGGREGEHVMIST